ncbi:KRAB domain-containing zinc finger protein [Sarotherodon galilaeus]
MTVTYNANVYADELDQEDVYVNSTVPTVEKHKPTSDKKRPFIIPDAVRPFLPLAGCWVILLIILFLRIHFTSVISAKLNQNLQEVISLNELWKQYCDDLNVQIYNMREAQYFLKNNVSNLNDENDRLKGEIQQVRAEKQSMSEEVQRLKAENQRLKKTYEYSTAIPTVTMWNTTSNITTRSVSSMWRQIEPCQRGWLQFKSSCYVTSYHYSLDQKTWEGARDDCRGRNSELVVIESPEEQDFVYSSLIRLGASDYWIGLRVKGGSWNWVDGRDLTDQ